MLDLHNHVLFGVDDGCRTPVESRALAQAMRTAGHEAVVATPHIRPGVFNNDPEGLRRRRDETRHIVEEAGLKLYLGAEYYFSPELMEAARAKTVLTLGETSRFVLIELPRDNFPPRLDDLLYELRLCGYIPVIAHPERCRRVAADVRTAIQMFRKAEVLLQLDLGSLVGHYGATAERTAFRLVDQRAYHVAACDLHRAEDVPRIVHPALTQLRRRLKKRAADDQLHRLTHTNPLQILNDAPLDAIAPM